MKKRGDDYISTGEKTLKPEKSSVMKKSAVRPVTKKNLMAIEHHHHHEHKDSKANFLDIVKQSAAADRQPAEATTTDGTIYS